jgi:hypothetical protein
MKMENQKNKLNLKQRSLEIEWMSYLKVKINKSRMLPINYVKRKLLIEILQPCTVRRRRNELYWFQSHTDYG